MSTYTVSAAESRLLVLQGLDSSAFPDDFPAWRAANAAAIRRLETELELEA